MLAYKLRKFQVKIAISTCVQIIKNTKIILKLYIYNVNCIYFHSSQKDTVSRD